MSKLIRMILIAGGVALLNKMSKLIRMILIAGGVALLNKMLKGSIWPQTNSMKMGRESKDQIIEIDDYEIVDGTQNRASEDHKVIIQ